MSKTRLTGILGLTVALIALLAGSAFAATGTADSTFSVAVEEIAELAIDGSVAELRITAPLVAGDAPQDAEDDTTYLQYTSTVGSNSSRALQAVISSGSPLAGLDLTVEAVFDPAALSQADGDIGDSTGEVALATNGVAESAKDIIVDIGSGYTGSGAGNGVQLIYRLKVNTVSELVANAIETITVNFTLMEDA
jgi:hypothetical protein